MIKGPFSEDLDLLMLSTHDILQYIMAVPVVGGRSCELAPAFAPCKLGWRLVG